MRLWYVCGPQGCESFLLLGGQVILRVLVLEVLPQGSRSRILLL